MMQDFGGQPQAANHVPGQFPWDKKDPDRITLKFAAIPNVGSAAHKSTRVLSLDIDCMRYAI